MFSDMKNKYIYFFILLFGIMGCDLKKDKGVPMNYREIPDSVLEKLVIEKGDTSAYYDLFVSYLETGSIGMEKSLLAKQMH